jgi:hypothetical protein
MQYSNDGIIFTKPYKISSVKTGLQEPQNVRSFQKDQLCGSNNLSQVSLSNMAKNKSILKITLFTSRYPRRYHNCPCSPCYPLLHHVHECVVTSNNIGGFWAMRRSFRDLCIEACCWCWGESKQAMLRTDRVCYEVEKHNCLSKSVILVGWFL